MPELTEKLQLQNKDLGYTLDYIRKNAEWPFTTIPPDVRKGKSLILCGAGPSLKNAARKIKRHKGDVWACNSAVNFLLQKHLRVTNGICVDNSARMYKNVWRYPSPRLVYYLASSVDPLLVAHLVHNSCRKIAFWHNYTSIEGEADLYNDTELYPPTIIAGEGLNVVNRALDLALYMGYSSIRIVGADCGFKSGGRFHADTDEMPEGRAFLKASPEFGKLIGTPGVRWQSTADMLMSAIDLAQKAQKHNGRIQLADGTLPYYLRRKDQAFFDRVIVWAGAKGGESQGKAVTSAT